MKELESDDLPPELSLTAAILVKHELMSLDDYYLYLTPTDDVIKSTIAAAKASTASANAPSSPLIKNQKAQFLYSLLAIGDLSHAYSLLKRFPDIGSLYPDIAYALARLIEVIIEPLAKRSATHVLKFLYYLT